MGWPTNKQEYIDWIDNLIRANQDEVIRPEQKRNNLMLISAFRKELKQLLNDEE